MARRYWLMKSEPGVFAWDDLEGAPRRTTCWDGVRNYQVRNFLRDEVRVGDGVLFYHSNADPTAVVGTARVVRAGYPDPSQFDRGSRYHDPGAARGEAPWYAVDIRAEKRFARPVTLDEMRRTPGLEGMRLLKRGNRLSVSPVSAEEWKIITKLGGV